MVEKLPATAYGVTDFGDLQLKADDDYPDLILSLARAVAVGTVDRGLGTITTPFDKTG